MKIAISNLAWDAADGPSVAELLNRFQITGIEIAPTKVWTEPLTAADDAVARYRDFWKERGIRIVAMQSLLFGQPDLRLFDETARAGLYDYLVGLIKLAAQLGAGPLVFGSPKQRQRGSLRLTAAMERAAAFFTPLAEVAYAHDTCLCIEPNPPEYGSDFILNTTEAVMLAQAVNHPGFGVNLDLGILTMNGEDYHAAIAAALPYLRHVHISEPHLVPVIAETVAHAQIARLLRQAGYQHWASIEMLIKPPAETLPTIERTLDFVTATYGT